MTKNYVDKSVECNLLCDLNLNDMINITNSSRLLKNLNKSIKNELKKIKTELLEINIKRNDLLNVIENFGNYLINDTSSRKNKHLLNRFKNIETPMPKIKNEHLAVLHEKFDQQIVELSNLFLNEKIDLIFKHNQLVDDLNQKLIETKSTNYGTNVDCETQTDLNYFKFSINQNTSKFFKGLEKIDYEKTNDDYEKNIDQESQTDHQETVDSAFQTEDYLVSLF